MNEPGELSRVGSATPRAERILAPNPGLMTLDGTNTWLLAEPDARRAVVVDPGPDDETHLRAVVDRARQRDLTVAVVIVTHGHPDHTAGLRRFVELTGAHVHSVDPVWRGSDPRSGGLVDGETITVDGLELRVIATPGHTADSVSLVMPADAAVLTGDTVLGRGTTVIAHPDGQLADYLDSLRRLRGIAEAQRLRVVLPGHGPVLTDPTAVVDGYLSHRAERLGQVEAILAEMGARAATADPTEVARRVYVDVDPAVLPAAVLSVRAQLDYLAAAGRR